MDISQFSLEGRVALVTGGSRGIGRAIALAFADAGADVVITSRNLADLERVAEEIRTKGRKGLPVASDIAKIEDSKSLVDRIKTEFGRVDILMNNAGTNWECGTLMDLEEWVWDTQMNVNLKGAFFLSQLVARMMREQGGGSIINIASAAGMKPGRIHMYSVAKAGLIMLTQVMAKEWGQYNIRVNAIAPGLTETQMADYLWKDPTAVEAAAQNTAMGRLAMPEDIAGPALFLAADISRHMTGETIIVDGGGSVGPPRVYPPSSS